MEFFNKHFLRNFSQLLIRDYPLFNSIKRSCSFELKEFFTYTPLLDSCTVLERDANIPRKIWHIIFLQTPTAVPIEAETNNFFYRVPFLCLLRTRSRQFKHGDEEKNNGKWEKLPYRRGIWMNSYKIWRVRCGLQVNAIMARRWSFKARKRHA